MTDAANTIEKQFEELKSQYQHACNIIKGLTDVTEHYLKNEGRQDRLIHALRETIRDLELRLVAAECKQCRCDVDVACTC